MALGESVSERARGVVFDGGEMNTGARPGLSSRTHREALGSGAAGGRRRRRSGAVGRRRATRMEELTSLLRGARTRAHAKAEAKEKVDANDDEEQQEEQEEEVVVGRKDQEQQRLFSNLDAETLEHRPGSVVGSISLVAGTTVGAGILALPAVTEAAGYAPSSAVIVGCWAYSCVTGLLLAEVNLRLMCELGRGGVSMLSMANSTFGAPGRYTAGATYVFLHYALLVAYLARGGELVAQMAEVSPGLASVAFCGLLGTTVYVADSASLDRVNTALVFGVVASFFGILLVAFANFDPRNLAHSDASAVASCVPVVALSFVYHNIVPTICSSLEGDRRKIAVSIAAGTSIPLVMFLLWNAAILGYSLDGAEQVGEAVDPLRALQEDPGVGSYITAFSLLAVATSFIGFVLGLVDFLSDALGLPTNSKNAVPFSLALLPPTAFAVVYPDAFLSALEYAGTYGVLALFGVLPAAMAWRTRSEGSSEGDKRNFGRMVPGGTATLALVGGSSLVVIIQQTLINLGATQQ